jgi:hypothetical protein
VSDPSFVQRFFLAFAAYFRILFDADFAARVLAAQDSADPLPPKAERPRSAAPQRQPSNQPPELPHDVTSSSEQSSSALEAADGALQVLSLLQRQGRFVDFVQQDISAFSDADIGQAARVVHEGCRATLNKYLTLEAVVDSEEGATTTVPSGFDARAIKLTGNVSGDAPYNGVLRHRGWRAQHIELPQTQSGHAFNVLAPAEVEV